MPQEWVRRLWEEHAPGNCRGTPEQLAVDEIADAAEGITQGDGRCIKIGQITEVKAGFAAIPPGAQHDADQTAVK